MTESCIRVDIDDICKNGMCKTENFQTKEVPVIDMGNIVDYVNKFQYTFSEQKFNDVDSLVLCQLSYLKMKHLIPGLGDGQELITFEDVLRKENRDQVFSDER